MSATGKYFSSCLALLLAVLATSTWFFVFAAVEASDAIPKQVSLIINGKRLVASNIRFSRFDEINLGAQERIEEQAEGKGVIVVITNQRVIGYGINAGWRDLKTQAGEKLESLKVEDFAVFVTTDMRYLNFNGETGVWGERDRRTAR